METGKENREMREIVARGESPNYPAGWAMSIVFVFVLKQLRHSPLKTAIPSVGSFITIGDTC